ncbi:unnamed protein product [Lactuca saligna]|uniref:Uncharacterized protein n=1 Tax=Lactuca saligna TaxID=75948 RepID=A0AA36A0P0_LACSI|nr:unnamed protein product [Lactuca saligna]
MKKPLNAAPMGSPVVEQSARKGDLISGRLPLVHYLRLRQPPIVERNGTEAAVLPSSGSDGCSFYPTTITQGGKDFNPQFIGKERNTQTFRKWPMTLNRSQGRAAIGGGKSLKLFSVVVISISPSSPPLLRRCCSYPSPLISLTFIFLFNYILDGEDIRSLAYNDRITVLHNVVVFS